jgi:hypothetical protein
VLVTGYSNNTNGGSDYATVAYSNAGLPLWTNIYSVSPDSLHATATSLTVDRSGNLFVTGYSFDDDGGQNYTTIKYSSIPPRPPQLDFQLNGKQLVLDWTNSEFRLQSAPAITGTFTNISNAISPYTNSVSDPQQFFRLISN